MASFWAQPQPRQRGSSMHLAALTCAFVCAQAMLLAQQGQPSSPWCLRLVDVQPGANPSVYLRDWAGKGA